MSDEKKQQVSRRQFLNYTLLGVGGFMAAGLLISPVRMAIDPVLKSTTGGGLVNVGLAANDVTEEPLRIDWTVDQVDGWYESTVSRSAWIYKNEEDEVIAFSPICTHLGCVISWEGNDDHPNQYYCPCHDGRFEKDGTNVPGTPPLAPLSRYEQEIRDGMVFLGEPIPSGEA